MNNLETKQEEKKEWIEPEFRAIELSSGPASTDHTEGTHYHS
jgi:hypothetical protein